MGELSYTTGGNSNLVSFRSAARVPITSLRAHFKPKQDLHGYSKPWPGGAGKNLLNPETALIKKYVGADGVVRYSADWFASDYIKVEAEQNYTISGATAPGGTGCQAFYDSNKDFISSVTGYDHLTFTTPVNTAYVRICARTENPTEVQFEKGSTATSYEPYENICPIEGWNQCEVYQDEVYLPKEYQRVDYLESNGTQYIDTEIYYNQNDKIIIDFMSVSGNTDHSIFGVYNQINGDRCELNLYSGKFRFDVDFTSFAYQHNYKYHIIRDGNNWYNGETKLYSSTAGHTNVNIAIHSILLFGRWYDDKVTKLSNSRIYNYTHIRNNIIIYNFVPCRRKSDNKPGMYDTVSGTFYTNAGTGEFICGPDIGQKVTVEFPVLGKNKFNWDVEQGHASPITSNYTTARSYPLNTYIIGMSSSNYYRDNYTNWVLNPSVSNGTISFSSGGASGYGIGYPLKLIPNQTYFLSGETTNNGTAGALYYDKDGALISTQSSKLNKTITVPSNTNITIIVFYATATNTSYTFSNIQLELGDTATTYEPYDSNNTVYGGYVDVAKGEIVQTWKVVDLGDYDWNYSSTANPPYFSHKFDDRKIGAFSLYCSDLALSNKTSSNNLKNYSYIGSTINGFVFIRNDSITSATDFINNMTGIKLAYELAEPIYYPLSKTELQTLLNQNNIWSNTNGNTEVSYAIHDSAPMRAARARIAANQPHIATASGNIASFQTDMKAPIQSLKVNFAPVQEGSGDPSPSNVRAIGGWTGLSINHTGKNLLDPIIAFTNQGGADPTEHVNFDGSVTVTARDGTSWITRGYLDLPPGTYYFYSEFGSEYNSRYIMNDVISEVNFSGKKAVTITEPTRFRFKAAMGTEYPVTGWLQVFAADDTYGEYPYINNTQSITWTSRGTIYGGYVDLITGEVYKDWNYVSMSNFNWGYSRGRFESGYITSAKYVLANEQTLYLENYKAITNRSGTTVPDKCGCFNTGNPANPYIVIVDNDYTDATTFKNSVADYYLAYKLKTPQLITTLTPTQLNSLRGANNIWTTANGPVDIQYWRH